MYLARTFLFDYSAVQKRRVSFMEAEIILRKNLVVYAHHSVSQYLRYYGGSLAGFAGSVCLNYAENILKSILIDKRWAVYNDSSILRIEIESRKKFMDTNKKSVMGSLVDIYTVYKNIAQNAGREFNSFTNLAEEILPLGWTQKFGIFKGR